MALPGLASPPAGKRTASPGPASPGWREDKASPGLTYPGEGRNLASPRPASSYPVDAASPVPALP
eukprot:376880-Alexandrium_andersonii.AAC.1